MKKKLVKLLVLVLVLTLAMPMYAFATVDELLTDTTAPGISLAENILLTKISNFSIL